MKILSHTFLPDDSPDWCNYLVLDITPNVAKLVLARRKLLQMVRSKDNGIWELAAWGIHGEFYDELDTEELLNEKQLAQWVESDSYIILPDDFDVGDAEPSRTECDCEVLSHFGVHYRCLVKHIDVYVETPEFPYELFIKASQS